MMTRTVLFDLDGTLLPVEMGPFLEQYVNALSKKFAGQITREAFGKALIDATYETICNCDRETTNLDAFAASFARLSGLPWESAWQTIERYYAEEYHELGKHITQTSLARDVVKQCVGNGWQIVLATQPIYPEQAVRTRLAWCGVDSMPWRFITTIDKMHYCKPQVEYYREISHLVGLDPSRCVMVGNNMQEDMVAKGAGMKTFLVEDYLINWDGDGRAIEPDGRGSLDDVPSGIEKLLLR